MVTLQNGNIKRQYKAQCDSGNTLLSGLAISEAVMKDLKLRRSNTSTQVSTAQKGCSMKSYESADPVYLNVRGSTDYFKCHPTVVQGLTGAVNIGTSFFNSLAQTSGKKVSLEYDGQKSTLKIKDKKFQMVNSVGHKDTNSTLSSSRPFSRYKKDQRIQVSGDKKLPKNISKKSGLTAGSYGTLDKRSRRVQPSCREKPQKLLKTKPKIKPSSHNRNVRVVSSDCNKFVRAKYDYILKKNTLTFVPVRMMNKSNRAEAISVQSVGHKKLLSRGEVINSVYKNDQKWGPDPKVAVINYSNENIYLRKGNIIGKFTELKEGQWEQGTIGKVAEQPPDDEIFEKIISDLKIKDNEYLKKDKKRLSEVVELIREYQDVFSSPQTPFGNTDLIEFQVDLKPGSEPVQAKVRPLNPRQQEDLKKTLEQWEAEGIVRPAPADRSSWASPMVPVLKKSGETRWCIDFRSLNAKTIPDRFPLPSIELNLEKLQGSSIYSTLDAAAAYHTIPVAKKSRAYLCFISYFGLFECLKMPFGAKNAAATYSRFVQKALRNLDPNHTLAYLDDIIIHTDNYRAHLKHLRAALQAHRAAGLKLKATKTHLFQSQVNYLGYFVSNAGIAMVPEYQEKALNWPAPQNGKQLAAFLGFTNFYRSFIKDYSRLTNEMNSIKNKEDQFQWTDVMQKKFEELKDRFRNPPVRGFPQYNSKEPFQLSVDFSKDNLGVILSQVQDGEERLISAHGRKTTSYEKNYASSKGELAALILGLRKYEHILRYKKFIIHTDNSGLTYLMSQKAPRGLSFRWLSEIQSYDFEIHHKPGRKNVPADSISRSQTNHLQDPDPEEVREQEEYVFKINESSGNDSGYDSGYESDFVSDYAYDNDGELITLSPIEAAETMNLTLESLGEAQREDPVLGKVIKWVQAGIKPTKEDLQGEPELLRIYAQQLPHFIIKDDLLYDKRKSQKLSEMPLLRVVVPENMYENIFKWSHSVPEACHPGVAGTYLKLASKFYFPGAASFVKQKIAVCSGCLTKKQSIKNKDHVHIPHRKGFVNECIFVDLVGPISPMSPQGHSYILTIEDGYSRYCQAIPILNKGGECVVNALYSNWVCLFGAPCSIHSDQGKEFTCKLQQDLAKKFNIKWTFTPSYNPSSNVVERFHRDLNKMLRIMLDEDGTEDWSRYLPSACLAHNSAVHSSTGLSPHFIFTGRECRLPIDIILPTPDSLDVNLEDHVKTVLNNFRRMYDYVRHFQNKTIKRNAKLYTGRKDAFKLGSIVWYFSPRKLGNLTPKLSNRWLGPFVVVEKISDVLYRIKARDYDSRILTVHVNRLALCHSKSLVRGQPIDVPSEEDIEQAADPEGEELLPGEDRRPPVPVSVPIAVPIVEDLVQRKRGRPPLTRHPQVPVQQYKGRDVEPNFRTPPGDKSADPSSHSVEMQSQSDISDQTVEMRDQFSSTPLRGNTADMGSTLPHSVVSSPVLSHPDTSTPPGDHTGATGGFPTLSSPVISPRSTSSATTPGSAPTPAPRRLIQKEHTPGSPPDLLQYGKLEKRVTRRNPGDSGQGGAGSRLKVQFVRDRQTEEIRDAGKKTTKTLSTFPLQDIIIGRGKKFFRSREKPEEYKRKREILSPPTDKPRSKKSTYEELWYQSDDSDTEKPDPRLQTLNSHPVVNLEVLVEQGSLLPVRGTALSAAWDITCSESQELPPGVVTRVPIKLKVALPEGFFLLLLSRSGLASKGITVQAGLIDPDFRSNLAVLLFNCNSQPFRINKGQRVAQAVILPRYNVDWKEVDHLPAAATEHAGFGSTGY